MVQSKLDNRPRENFIRIIESSGNRITDFLKILCDFFLIVELEYNPKHALK